MSFIYFILCYFCSVFAEVTKALQARKSDKMKKMQNDLGDEKQKLKEKHRNHHEKQNAAQRRHSDAHSDKVKYFWGFNKF